MTTEVLGRCHVGETAYYRPAGKAEGPGHCYSKAGLREFLQQSGYCEYHFDLYTSEEDEEPCP